jgi:MoxR-like ATPase
VLTRVQSVFVGERPLLDKVMAAALANGHVLFEDYPGLGKTLLMKVFAKALGCRGTRVQFTPDILPADILGAKVWNGATGEFKLEKGPVFTNILLADEINRAPPKTQSALLEAMDERQVTIEGETHRLEPPFFVLATQNPLEQEGTYPLPEAQMDRFLMRLSTGYPRDAAAEREILKRRISWKKDDPTDDVQPALGPTEFRELQEMVETHDAILDYIGAGVRGLREHPALEVGPSPRGSLALLRVSRAYAMLKGRDFVTPDDVRLLAVDCLAHRSVVNVDHALEGYQAKTAVNEVFDRIQAPNKFRRGE